MKRTPIGKAKRRPIQIRRISKKRLQEIKDEVGIRIALEARCKGRCEKCGRKPDWRGLSKHEIKSRSRGGDPTDPNNCLLLCGECHSAEGHIIEIKSEPQWTKEQEDG